MIVLHNGNLHNRINKGRTGQEERNLLRVTDNVGIYHSKFITTYSFRNRNILRASLRQVLY